VFADYYTNWCSRVVHPEYRLEIGQLPLVREVAHPRAHYTNCSWDEKPLAHCHWLNFTGATTSLSSDVALMTTSVENDVFQHSLPFILPMYLRVVATIICCITTVVVVLLAVREYILIKLRDDVTIPEAPADTNRVITQPLAALVAKEVRLRMFACSTIVDSIPNRQIAFSRIMALLDDHVDLRNIDRINAAQVAINLVFIPDEAEIEVRRMCYSSEANDKRLRYRDAKLFLDKRSLTTRLFTWFWRWLAATPNSE